jgi:hypothetical protein
MTRKLGLGATTVALVLGALALTTTTGSAATGGPCANPGSVVCSTLATAADGTSVLRVYAPAKYPVKAFDIWTGTKTTSVRPASICKKHSTADGAEYQEGTIDKTSCKETIKPGHVAIYCFKGGGPIPSADGSSTFPVYIDAGSAGADNAKLSSSKAACPASVAKRKVK